MKISKRNGKINIVLTIEEAMSIAKKVHANGLIELVSNKPYELLFELSIRYALEKGACLFPNEINGQPVHYHIRTEICTDYITFHCIPVYHDEFNEEEYEDEEDDFISDVRNQAVSDHSFLDYEKMPHPDLDDFQEHPHRQFCDQFEEKGKTKSGKSSKKFAYRVDKISTVMDGCHNIRNGVLYRNNDDLILLTDAGIPYFDEHGKLNKCLQYEPDDIICRIKDGKFYSLDNR